MKNSRLTTPHIGPVETTAASATLHWRLNGMKRWKRLIVFQFPAFLYMGLIFYVSSRSEVDLYGMSDHLLHLLAYCGLYVLVFWALNEELKPRSGRGGYWLPLIITALYGLSDEFHQSFVPNRDASVSDLIADIVGAVLAVPLTVFFSRLISPLRRRQRY